MSSEIGWLGAGAMLVAWVVVGAVRRSQQRKRFEAQAQAARDQEYWRQARAHQHLAEQHRKALAELESGVKLTFELVDADGVITERTLYVVGYRPRLKRIECFRADPIERVDLMLNTVVSARSARTGEPIDLMPFLRALRAATRP